MTRNRIDLPTDADRKAIAKALAEPFEPTEIKFKPQSVKGNRALALAYVDVRAIEDRLDEVVGVENWQDAYELLPDQSVMCRLRVKIGGKWISKADVGSPSEQPDGGDRMKAAFSDALKRAAVKFGIGRYLYRLKADWCDYDPQARKIVTPPTLPAFAMPRKKVPLPTDGPELVRRLTAKDAELARLGKCAAGELVRFIGEAGKQAGYGSDMNTWPAPAIALAVQQARTFQARSAAVPGTVLT